MLIEEILPINYYNQLIGVLVDTTICKTLIKNLMPKLYAIINNNKDYEGNYIGEMFINKILVNLFVSKSINKNITLLIFDYLFLKGNKIIFQALLSIYQFLSDFIIKCDKSIESFEKIINEDLKNLTIDNEEFIYNLFFNYEKAISKIGIDDSRNYFSSKISESFEDNNIEFIKLKVKTCYNTELYKNQLDNFLKCRKEWPYCINDSYFENVKGVVENFSFTKGKINYIDNYFFSNKQNKKENEMTVKDKGKVNYNILLERRPHYCSEIENEINLNLNEKNKINKENKIEENVIKDDINKIEEDEKEEEINNKLDFIKKAMTEKDLLNISKVIEEKITDDIYIPKTDDS